MEIRSPCSNRNSWASSRRSSNGENGWWWNDLPDERGSRMKSIRTFSKDDIPQVIDMFQRLLLRNEGARLQSRDLLPDYFEQIFFCNPWYDEEISSLVYVNASGKVVGFLGVIPRPMLMQRHPIRMAISLHYMVEPESRTSLAGVHLLKAFFAGPQDLSLTD